MSIVNCRVENIRPKYVNLKEWMDDCNNVYIARANVVFIDKERFPKQSSKFANPFKIGKHGTRDEVIDKYNDWMKERLNNDVELRAEFMQLKGKNLGCWCCPERCHGSVILQLLDMYSAADALTALMTASTE